MLSLLSTATATAASMLLFAPLRCPSVQERHAFSAAGRAWGTRSTGVRMGVSDRMATDGMLYDGWGAEGMRVLNRTATLQSVADVNEVSRYDAVLIVAARAKENAYRETEEDVGGYIGNSFGGAMGSGMRKKAPVKSQVVTAIEELLEEHDVTGELPELITPGIPEELLEEMEAENAQQGIDALADELGIEASDLDLMADPTTPQSTEDSGAVDAVTEDEFEIDEDFDEDGDESDDLDDDLVKSLFGDLESGSDASLEATGLSPGDSG